MNNPAKPKQVLTIKRALVSVSDKTGVVEFATSLEGAGVEIISTGGTAHLLSDSGLKVQQVSDITGQAELMGGRVKTLHPKIHGGILGRLDVDQEEMTANEIQPIDLVAVSLYPFEAVSQAPDASVDKAIENIDIGGPTMIRAAAKNFQWTCVVVDSADYAVVAEEIRNTGGVGLETRFKLAAKAFRRTLQYESAISSYFDSLFDGETEFPDTICLSYQKREEMRYGENPHQKAAFYAPLNLKAGQLASAKLLQGKPLSFNNLVDAEAAWNCALEFDEPACVIIKHATPCGVAQSENLSIAYDLAFETDPTSAFGGVIAFNRPLNGLVAKSIVERQFVEVIVAPSFQRDAVEIFTSKDNVRVLECGEISNEYSESMVLKSLGGGLLLQEPDNQLMASTQPTIVTEREPSESEVQDLLFSWRVAKHVKSNAIVFGKDGRTIGIGAGQMSRVDSAAIASMKAKSAKLDVSNSVMASDAFFPFRDGIDTAYNAGIRAVIQPGGSMRDSEVIDAANEHGMAMLFTGMRHFRH